jgi:hypothetical protein
MPALLSMHMLCLVYKTWLPIFMLVLAVSFGFSFSFSRHPVYIHSIGGPV